MGARGDAALELALKAPKQGQLAPAVILEGYFHSVPWMEGFQVIFTACLYDVEAGRKWVHPSYSV